MSTEARPNHIEEDRDAAMSLLRLHIVGHRYVKGCKSNGGLACYCCRTVEWLEAHSDYRHVSPPPAPEGTVEISLSVDAPNPTEETRRRVSPEGERLSVSERASKDATNAPAPGSVKHTMPVGDGITDDTAAVQALYGAGALRGERR